MWGHCTDTAKSTASTFHYTNMCYTDWSNKRLSEYNCAHSYKQGMKE